MSIVGAFIVPHPPIILPEVGKGEEAKIEKTANAYREAARRAAALHPDTVVITSPHSVLYADYFHISPGESARGDLRRFGVATPAFEARYDTQFAAALCETAGKTGLPAGTLGERDKDLDHGTLIPLRFLSEGGCNCPLVRIGLSGLPPADHYRLGQCIAETAALLGRRTVLVASGDLSHKLKPEGPYGFAPEGPRFDEEVTRAMAGGDFLRFLTFDEPFCDAAAECGLRSFQILAGALDGLRVQAELLSYEGPFGVGYAVASFMPGETDKNRRIGAQYQKEMRDQQEMRKAKEDAYVRLARLSVETFVKTGRRAHLPDKLPDEMRDRQAGVFVSLKAYGRLRGCIGTIAPVTDSVAEEILRNGVSACSQDPRFDPVREDELETLVYSVDVLEKPEPVASPEALDPKEYGVIVTKGHRRGLLLPNLDGVDTVERQIAIAKQKAGIGAEEPCALERFKVVRHL